ncbi:hypothetical protein DDE83_008520 [Stemphylium lycopersici]|uniref:Rhodopsin domain-containing protein n=1 Tax=Stemphylium lycopersici TaxID=183478 RepID=A0A364MSZ0_STELY|nr:hypothetical protein DDE83_008520 [Stemphylium lycopersici]
MASQLENFKSDPSETHGPLMSIMVWMQCGVAALFLCVRFLIQKAQGKLWIDDLLLTIAWLFLFCQAILNQLGINLGFGKHALDIDFSHFDRITYYGATALTVSLAAITISKISFGVTLLRLTDGYLKMYVWFAIVTMTIFAIPAAVLPWTLCKPLAKTFVDILPGTCINKEPSVIYGRFQADDAYNSVIWSVAEAAMTMVATSIPVLRVFVRRASNTAMENFRYNVAHGKSSRSGGSSYPSGHSKGSHGSSQYSKRSTCSKCSHCSRAGVMLPPVSLGRSRLMSTLDNFSEESLVEANGRVGGSSSRAPKHCIEMKDIVVDEQIGRVSATTPESLVSAEYARAATPSWPL